MVVQRNGREVYCRLLNITSHCIFNVFVVYSIFVPRNLNHLDGRCPYATDVRVVQWLVQIHLFQKECVQCSSGHNKDIENFHVLLNTSFSGKIFCCVGVGSSISGGSGGSVARD
jgi:hypothetical protein